MYRNPTTGQGTLTIGKTAAAVLAGEDDVSTWDDEELVYGRRRDANGGFSGPRPRVIPAVCYAEWKRRQLFDSDSTFGQSVKNAAKYIADVAEGREQANAGRLRACEIVQDRFVGKPKERIEAHVDMTVENEPWAVALRRAIRTADGRSLDQVRSSELPPASPSDDDIIDAELVEDDEPSQAVSSGAKPSPRPAPSEEDLKVWRQNNGPILPTDSSGRLAGTGPEPEPVLSDDEDDFIEETDDDPILW